MTPWFSDRLGVNGTEQSDGHEALSQALVQRWGAACRLQGSSPWPLWEHRLLQEGQQMWACSPQGTALHKERASPSFSASCLVAGGCNIVM